MLAYVHSQLMHTDLFEFDLMRTDFVGVGLDDSVLQREKQYSWPVSKVL